MRLQKFVNFSSKKTKKSLINIGSPIEMSIKNYANLVKKKIDPSVLIKFNNDKNLDGVMRKIKSYSCEWLWMEIKNELFKDARRNNTRF